MGDCFRREGPGKQLWEIDLDVKAPGKQLWEIVLDVKALVNSCGRLI